MDLEFNKWFEQTANGIWLTFPGDPSISENVRPEIFTPVTRHVGSLICRTYSITTQQKINRLPAFERPKDKRAFSEYDSWIASLDRSSLQAEDLPLSDELYTPFTRFAQGIKEKQPGYVLACRVGVAVNSLPPGLQMRLKRLGAPIRKHFLA